ncbi:MAG: hypothetical protein EHM39_05710 [Chloroflexi bacterium]|nr:MAG: hypothetical protein EHM39_05710 [Chloroflexota bacterium]
MKLDVLLGGLENPQPAVRLDVVRVLGMLDETRALDALRRCYPAETDPDVRNALAWAGKRLYQAQQAGYSTIDELFRFFNIDKEIENTPDDSEQQLLDKMADSLHQDLLSMQERAHKKKVGLAIAAGLAGGVVAGASVGLTMLAGGLASGADASSTGMGGRPQIGTTRTPPTAPANTEITIWLRRFRESPAPEQREQAAIQLCELNNPKALPHLAAAFLNDDSPQVRQAAQRYGKILYWRAVYWEMEQNGTIAEEMMRRAAAMGKTIRTPKSGPAGIGGSMPLPDSAAPGTPAAGPAQGSTPEGDVDVGEILRKAKEARQARHRKQGR